MIKQEMIPYRVSRTTLNLQDLPISLDEITLLTDSSVFSLDRMHNRPYEKDYTFVAGISLEMNLDLTVFERRTYSLLDAFADIGGLTELLTSTISFIAVIFNYNLIESYLATNLFKMKQEKDSSPEDSTIIIPSRCFSIRVLMISLFP